MKPAPGRLSGRCLVLVLLCMATMTGPAAGQPAAAPVIVTIRDFSFEPHEIKIAVNGMVRWLNADPSPHAIAMEGGRPGSSSQIAPGQAHAFIFQESGTFTYRCGVHPTMLGVIIVGP